MILPLEGFRVLDATTWFQSVASRMMGDLGAEVIKIEPRQGGDPVRSTMSVGKLLTGEETRNVSFEHANFNKMSMTLDLRNTKGREILYKLVEKSDVLVHNLREQVAVKLGLDYPTVSKHNSQLIYALGSAWGSKGEGSNRASYDRMALARSGLMTYSGKPGTPPTYINASIADHMGATMLTLATVAALLSRERTGTGGVVESSLLGSMMHLMGLNVDKKLATNEELVNADRSSAPNPLWNEYMCKDGKGISLGMLQSNRHWHSLCETVGIQHLEHDIRFESAFQRAKNAAELVSILDEVFASKTRLEWMNIMNERGDLIFEPINGIADLVEDP